MKEGLESGSQPALDQFRQKMREIIKKLQGVDATVTDISEVNELESEEENFWQRYISKLQELKDILDTVQQAGKIDNETQQRLKTFYEEIKAQGDVSKKRTNAYVASNPNKSLFYNWMANRLSPLVSDSYLYLQFHLGAELSAEDKRNVKDTLGVCESELQLFS